MTYRLEVTRQFLRDLKLARKRNLDEEKLNEIIRMLSNGEKLPAKNKDHVLSGNYAGIHECHITPDWLLLYSIDSALYVLSLVRTGTHSDLF